MAMVVLNRVLDGHESTTSGSSNDELEDIISSHVGNENHKSAGNESTLYLEVEEETSDDENAQQFSRGGKRKRPNTVGNENKKANLGKTHERE